jgi:hypothetical protein
MSIDHDGWYNPWDELKKPDVKAAYDKAVASGGFAFRTGVVHITPGSVRVSDDFTVTIGPAKYWHVGDGLQIVSFDVEPERDS